MFLIFGSKTMPRQITITDRIETGESFQVRAAFWLAPPAKSRPIKASRSSSVPNASEGELDAIASGAVVERVQVTGNFPTATTDEDIQTQLVEQYGIAQAQLNQELKGGALLGSYWDGSTWTSTDGILVANPVTP